MSSWLTEQDLRHQHGEAASWPGLTLNVAFLQEIKQDVEQPAAIIETLRLQLATKGTKVPLAELVSLLEHLRDELETYFALEEFYGYFQAAQLIHPHVSNCAHQLQSQHEAIYMEVCHLVELAHRVLYREVSSARVLPTIVEGFQTFVQRFQAHEQQESELMMRLCNDEIGVGD